MLGGETQLRGEGGGGGAVERREKREERREKREKRLWGKRVSIAESCVVYGNVRQHQHNSKTIQQ